MVVTYLKKENKYVDSAGRLATVTEYGKDFYNCLHSFIDTDRRGEVVGPNGRRIRAAAYQCKKCFVFTTIELSR